ncbi:phytase [Membranihabitans marinus]|uniref:phytase n=1 Tax=Membranihabitans marinus TaxID=1227546 RepID=UPI001F025B2A|nr:phytase [Membranihabitans marinus]
MTSLKNKINSLLIGTAILSGIQCSNEVETRHNIEPTLITEAVPHDTDDPAIWIHPSDIGQSLVIGTDKEIGGGVYSFGLDGKIIDSLSLKKVNYPNNVDLLTQIKTVHDTTDIIAFTERESHRVRIYSYPSLKAMDGGGFPVFENQTIDSLKRPMGIAFYRNPRTEESYFFVSRKHGNDGAYIYQYKIHTDTIPFSVEKVRAFGGFSGEPSEIEALMVDNYHEYLYYSDEAFGIRKYYADPSKGDAEINIIGKTGFTEDREGIALWPTDKKGNGYIIVSNQQDNSFNVYNRRSPHEFIGNLSLSTTETDGCDLYPDSLNAQFPNGIFIAMSEEKTFHFYDLGLLEEYLKKE